MVEDLLIRPAEPGDIESLIDINITVWHSTYRGIIHDEFLDAMTPDLLRKKWERILQNIHTENTECFVAVMSGKVVGYVICGKNTEKQFDFDWQLYAIYLFKELQGRGIGKALFLHAFEAMRKRGVKSCIVFAIEGNQPTRAFYEAFGPNHQTQKIVRLGEVDYVEIGYGWTEI